MLRGLALDRVEAMTKKNTFPWEQPAEEPNHRFLLDYTYEELAKLVSFWGLKEANAKLIFKAIQRQGLTHPDDFDMNHLNKRALARLRSPEAPPLKVFQKIEAYPSTDGSVKYLYTLSTGEQVESVFMPFENRNTLCVSSQVGCALGCTFCATGAMGFRRHLTPGEMIGQVLNMRRMHPDPTGHAARANVVFMGMGEPLHNLNNLLRAFDILTHQQGLVLSEKDVAISTSGLVPKIELLGQRKRRPRLMVSIAATTNEARSAIMPVNRAYPLEALIQSLKNFKLQKNERIMLSYVLIAGVNDHPDDAKRLAAMSLQFPSLVNIIPMNAHDASPGMVEPSEARLQNFYQTLIDEGCFATIRRSRGRDVAAACGQLITSTANRVSSN